MGNEYWRNSIPNRLWRGLTLAGFAEPDGGVPGLKVIAY